MSTRQSRGPASRPVHACLSGTLRRSVIAVSIATLLGGNAYAQVATGAADPEEEPEQTRQQQQSQPQPQPPAQAQPSPPATPTQLDAIVVTGVRAGLRTAQTIKQDAEQMVDSIVAEDIGKLPDNNVAEALQRISGIQIDRNFGEGANIAIRGLTQVRTELNGRDVFTANQGRALSFEDVPAELLAGIDVYKNPAADIIEGGLGGTVNLRTRMPFDFEDRQISASVGLNRWDLTDENKPSYSALFSDRWDTGIGEFGLLVNLSYQEHDFRQDTISTEPFWETTGIPGREGETLVVPRGGGIASVFGDRRRLGTALALQWRPNDDTELYFQMLRSDYKFKWRDYSYFAFTGDSAITPAAGFPFAFTPGGEFLSGTFQDVSINSNTSLATRDSVTTDYAIGGSWTPTDRLTVSTDFQYIKATTDELRYIVSMNAVAPLFHHDISGDLPSMTVTGPNGETGLLTDPANYNWGFLLDHKDDNEGDEFAWRGDVEYEFDDSFLQSIKGGLRYTDRSAENKSSPFRFFGLFVPLSAFPDAAFGLNPFSDFFRGQGGLLGGTLAATDGLVADYENSLAMFGQNVPLVFGPADINSQGEKTYAAYGVARFAFDAGATPVDGNVGVRVVRTEVESVGIMTDPEGSGALLPIDVSNSYTSVLPSLNVRVHLTDELQWRIAMSKGLSRPGFDRLAPNLFLSTTEDEDGNIISRTGSAGNPNLEPMKADQFDTSLEWYFADTGMLYGTLFYKKVDGFIATGTFNEVYNGETYEVTRPVNGDDGRIRGFEVGWQQFFDFLPSPFDGIGMQANYTYVDSEAPSPAATDTSGRALSVPLEGLSKNSYNVVAFYEKGPISARLAYNWRSDWVRTTSGNGTGNLPIYSEGFGQLDASITYAFNDIWSITLDGVNLTDTERSTIFGLDTRPRDSIINDRRYGVTLRMNLY